MTPGYGLFTVCNLVCTGVQALVTVAVTVAVAAVENGGLQREHDGCTCLRGLFLVLELVG